MPHRNWSLRTVFGTLADVTLDSQQVEIIGTSYLVAQLTADGIEVARPERDRGVDLVAFLDRDPAGWRSVPIQLKASTGRMYSVHAKYAVLRPLMAYVWHVTEPANTVAYALTYDESLDVARTLGWLDTPSWARGGYTTTRPGKRVLDLLEPFRMRSAAGDWLRKIREVAG